MHKLTRTILALVFTLGIFSAAAHADSVTITFDSPTQSVAPGGTVSFYATIAPAAGNTGQVYLNGDSFDFALSPFTVDDSAFYANAPVSLNPGDSPVDILIFTVLLDPGALPGTDYTGTFELQGGVDGNDQTVLGAPEFTITALGSVSATPEPSGLLLLGTGLVAMLGLTKRGLRRAYQ